MVANFAIDCKDLEANCYTIYNRIPQSEVINYSFISKYSPDFLMVQLGH